MTAQRAKKKIEAPHLTNSRKTLKGKRYKQGRVETRGRGLTFSRAMALRMDAKRKEFIKTADNRRGVRWGDVRRGARVPKGHRSTLKKAFDREKIPVAARRPRQKPQRTPEHEAERYEFAKDGPPTFDFNRLTENEFSEYLMNILIEPAEGPVKMFRGRRGVMLAGSPQGNRMFVAKL